MTEPIDYWKFLAGLGLFLFAIKSIEDALKVLAGRSFKKLLQKHTTNKFKSVLVGIFSTAILQSSSAVTLMLLAMVSSGVVAFANALGIILGANLGTTFTGWIVSTLGFELNINKSILPIIAIGSLLYVFSVKRKLFADWGKFLLGLGFLLLGLSFMKDSLFDLRGSFDPARLAEHNILVFALVGFIFTAIIQSSSATMVITLTALNAGVFNLENSAALIIGADLGTTTTVILGTITGGFERKRVAAAHFIFNLVTDIIALALLPILLSLSLFMVGHEKPLYALVFFHSSFNLLGIFIFWPFLDKFSIFLERRYKPNSRKQHFLGIEPQHTNAAIEAIRLECHTQTKKTAQLSGSALKQLNSHLKIKEIFLKQQTFDFMNSYNDLKSTEALLTNYSLQIQKEALSIEQSKEIKNLLSAIRNCSMSAKSVKDILHNLEEFKNSSNDIVHDIFVKLCQFQESHYKEIESLITSEPDLELYEKLHSMLDKAEEHYDKFAQEIITFINENKVPAKYISNLLNTNKELYNSNRLLILAIGESQLNTTQAEKLIAQSEY